jgi:hypothetical protein
MRCSRWLPSALSGTEIIYNDLHTFLLKMDRPKRPPPVPKFEDRTNKTELEAKLNSFMSSINQTQNESSAQSAKTEPVQPPKAENKAEPTVKVE